MSVVKLNTTNFDTAITNGTVLVDFYTDRCRSCRTFSRITREIASERDDITVGKVNVESDGALARQYDVIDVPTLIVFKDGKEKARFGVYRPKEAILAEL